VNKLPVDDDLQGYIIYADSYYGSIELAKFLIKLKKYFILATQSNRGAKLWSILQKNLQKGDWSWLAYCDDAKAEAFYAISYFDNAKVTLHIGSLFLF
jgi:hypothetical protein